MRDAVVFRGVPNHPESAACSTGTAVSVGSPVLTAQATWGVRADQESLGWSVVGFGGVDVARCRQSRAVSRSSER